MKQAPVSIGETSAHGREIIHTKPKHDATPAPAGLCASASRLGISPCPAQRSHGCDFPALTTWWTLLRHPVAYIKVIYQQLFCLPAHL